MKERTIAVAKKDYVTTVTFRGRKDLNILDGGVVTRLGAAIGRLGNDPMTRVVVLRGSGGRAFSAGVDVRVMKEFTPVTMEKFIRSLHSVMMNVMSISHPVIASINGPCLGGAFELVMACDMRIAADDAIFGLPEIKVGIPSVIEASLLARFIGWGRATELILTGDTIDAQEAARIGLVNRVVSKKNLAGATMKVARGLSLLSPYALGVQKDILRKWLELGHEQGAEYSMKALALCFDTPVPREGMEAFLQKREARYPE
jgi:enoyl-CoA hydratase